MHAWLLGGALVLGSATPGAAHDGPPFPIVVDAPMGAYLVSVWTDPDIGIGTFFVIVDGPGENGVRSPDVVQVAVRPASGRLAEVVHTAEPQVVRRGAQYLAEVPFDRGESWHVRVQVIGADGSGEVGAEVVPTPDGSIGPIGLVVYAVPFVLVAALWVRVSLVRRRTRA
jgi:hypothetical protein